MNQTYEQRINEELLKSYLKKPSFSDDDINNMNALIESKDLISDEEKDKIKKLGSLSLEQDYNLSVLFSRCYDYFLMIKDFLFDEENDFRSKVGEYLGWYKQYTNVDSIRFFVQECDNVGGGIGTHYYHNLLKTKVLLYREEFMNFISLFTKIAGVED